MKILKVLFLSLLIIGCKQENEVPEDLIPRDQLVPIMLDIYLAEVKLSNLKINRDSITSIFKTYEEYLLEKHNTNREQYMRSMAYYYDNTEKLEEIYEALLDTLTVKETKFKAIEDAKKAREDSLKNMKQPKK